jgi:phosphate transport system substrate-binding protein
MNSLTKLFAIAAGAVLISSCGGGSASGKGTRKKAMIYFEESYKPLFETSIYTYEGLHPSDDIIPVYRTEGEIIKDFFAKKMMTICITRDFTADEKARLRKAQIEVRSTMIAHDAVALIIHPDNPDSTLSVDRLKRILTGEDSLWKSSGKKINVVFDQANSANFNYMHGKCIRSKIQRRSDQSREEQSKLDRCYRCELDQ